MFFSSLLFVIFGSIHILRYYLMTI